MLNYSHSIMVCDLKFKYTSTTLFSIYLFSPKFDFRNSILEKRLNIDIFFSVYYSICIIYTYTICIMKRSSLILSFRFNIGSFFNEIFNNMKTAFWTCIMARFCVFEFSFLLITNNNVINFLLYISCWIIWKKFINVIILKK